MKKHLYIFLFLAGLFATHCVNAETVSKERTAFPLSQVRLLDSPFKLAQEKDAKYLLSVDADRLLAKFRGNAGLEPKKPAYGAWEAESIAGHSLGHYLSALSLMYAATGDSRFKEKADYVVTELAECQAAGGDGLVSAIPGVRKAFDEISRGDIRTISFQLNGLWVPWYAQHKVCAGLLDAHAHCGNTQALEVVKKLGDWGIETLKNLTEEQFQEMLVCEFGGMNESYFELYSRTGEEKYAEMGKRFFHKKFMAPFMEGTDGLPGKHGNTQFPKIIGHAREYEMTGNPEMKNLVEFFWDCVVNHHTYVTGGNTISEHFGPRDTLNDRLGNECTESCNTYNMLKMTKHLYEWSGDVKYYDFYERALYNHILPSADVSEDANKLFSYFIPLQAGGFRTYSSPENTWTCCHGTGMENHAKYGEGIYYLGKDAETGKDTVYVNLLIPSVLDWKEKGVTITIFSVGQIHVRTPETGEASEFTLKVRVPRNMACEGAEDGYFTAGDTWPAGKATVTRVPLVPRWEMETMPDNENRVAFFLGPWLMAGNLGETGKPLAAEFGPLPDEKKNPQPVLVCETRDPAQMIQNWKLTAAKPAPVEMIPFFLAKERYAVYFDLFTEESWKAESEKYIAEQERRKRQEELTVDFFQPGEMQPERDHEFAGENSHHGEAFGRKWRDARDGGSFEFSMKVDAAKPCRLVMTYWGSDAGNRNFDIVAEGVKIGTQKLQNNVPERFFDVEYAIPEEVAAGREKIRVRLQAHEGMWAGGLFGCRVMREDTP